MGRGSVVLPREPSASASGRADVCDDSEHDHGMRQHVEPCAAAAEATHPAGFSTEEALASPARPSAATGSLGDSRGLRVASGGSGIAPAGRPSTSATAQ